MPGRPSQLDTDADRAVSLDELVARILSYGGSRRIRLAIPIIGRYDFPLKPSDSATGDGTASPLQPAPRGSEGQPGLANRESSSLSGASAESKPQTKFVVPAGRLPKGLPDWFLGRDADGDGQLSQAEFAPKPTQADLEEFARYDLNRDGVITPSEYLRAIKAPKTPDSRPAGKQPATRPRPRGS